MAASSSVSSSDLEWFDLQLSAFSALHLHHGAALLNLDVHTAGEPERSCGADTERMLWTLGMQDKHEKVTNHHQLHNCCYGSPMVEMMKKMARERIWLFS